MRNIKETVIGVFAVIGFVVVASGFTTNNAVQEPTYGTPESHVWEMHMRVGVGVPTAYAINKVTGDVKLYTTKVKLKGIVGAREYTPEVTNYDQADPQ